MLSEGFFMNKHKLSDTEIKAILLDMLKYVDSFCLENNITYYLFYGTLLGAVRHNGFIPWDDDVDIIMPRDSFHKLVELFNKSTSRYKLESIYTNDNYYFPLSKIVDNQTYLKQRRFKWKTRLGLYIDVFILDGLPDDQREQKRIYDLSNVYYKKCWRTALSFRQDGNSLVKDCLRYIKRLNEHIRGQKYYLWKLEKLSKSYEFNKCNYVCNLNYCVYFPKEIYQKTLFTPIRHQFENIECFIPERYDEILKQIYGEWKKLPPVNQRVGIHDYECFLDN